MFRIFSIIVFVMFVSICNISYADSRLDNCMKYKDEILSYLSIENISSDYFYLAVCESGCRIKTSTKGARGFFQLMKNTYMTYKPDGCNSKDIDNIRCNTIAAARYIKHLSKRFNSTSMIVKAYNRGGTNLQRKGSTHEADALSRCVMKYINNKNL